MSVTLVDNEYERKQSRHLKRRMHWHGALGALHGTLGKAFIKASVLLASKFLRSWHHACHHPPTSSRFSPDNEGRQYATTSVAQPWLLRPKEEGDD